MVRLTDTHIAILTSRVWDDHRVVTATDLIGSCDGGVPRLHQFAQRQLNELHGDVPNLDLPTVVEWTPAEVPGERFSYRLNRAGEALRAQLLAEQAVSQAAPRPVESD